MSSNERMVPALEMHQMLADAAREAHDEGESEEDVMRHIQAVRRFCPDFIPAPQRDRYPPVPAVRQWAVCGLVAGRLVDGRFCHRLVPLAAVACGLMNALPVCIGHPPRLSPNVVAHVDEAHFDPHGPGRIVARMNVMDDALQRRLETLQRLDSVRNVRLSLVMSVYYGNVTPGVEELVLPRRVVSVDIVARGASIGAMVVGPWESRSQEVA